MRLRHQLRPTRGMDGRQGVLLYYQYQDLAERDKRQALHEWYVDGCHRWGLRGRVRIAQDGVNVTVGGSWEACLRHVEEAKRCDVLEKGIDFKLEEADLSNCNETILKETGFDGLSVRITHELVTLGPRAKVVDVSNTGQHVTPEEFHKLLQRLEERSRSGNEAEAVLIDTRNAYESRIGRFDAHGLTCLQPELRSFAQFPEWVDENLEQIRGREILMYCTGGVRCERASAFVKGKGKGFENVKQLSGGIVRYLQKFQDGGYFRGKNFVFDPRVAVGNENGEVVGQCVACGSKYDDYSMRVRCMSCRMLLLLCQDCQKEKSEVHCNMCAKARDPAISRSEQTLRPLRILVLHGFRQNASNMRGRMSALRKQLRHVAEFVYMDAPHELPFYYLKEKPEKRPGLPRRGWLVLPEQLGGCAGDWEPAPEGLDPMQFTRQVAGWAETKASILDFLEKHGPFDGIMGFSQGAMVASLTACMLCLAENDRHSQARVQPPFQFGIFCSGYPAYIQEHVQLYKQCTPIPCPSLHIFGGGGHDRQISRCKSEELADLFADKGRMVIRHDSGHLIPSNKLYRDQYVSFLTRFQACS